MDDFKFMLVSAILVLLVMLPFILLPFLQNSDRKKLDKKFHREEKNNDLHIGLKELWNQNFIGIDPTQKKLLFVQKNEEEFIVECIDLNTVNSCKPHIEEISVKKDKKTENLLTSVYLEFSFKNSEVKKSIKLFDDELHISQDLEVKHANKWADLIKQQLNTQTALKRTA